jgi:hypothetical protein
MKINVTVRRGKEWVKAQRLATAENVPNDIVVSVEVSKLSVEARKRLLDYSGGYHDTACLSHGSDYKPYHGTTHGTIYYVIDSASPTTSEISEAICAAFAELDAKRAELITKEEARNAEKARVAAEKEARDRKFAEARELLKSELEALKTERDKLKRARGLLSEFLATIPLDALRGAVKKQLTDESEIASRQKLIEDASDEWIFSNRDNDDDNDE